MEINLLILALNNLIEKKLITDQNEILEYCNFEETVTQKDRQDLIILKSSLFEKNQ